MCGIVGVIDLKGEGRLPSADVFDTMVDSLARRGPDGRGVHRTRHAALGHRRLAILDTSAASNQPWVEGNCALVFNGEIYNFRALRTELEGLGHHFSTTGDTEVLLRAWRQWGSGCVRRLNGIFAFVVVDGDTVFVARDHTGIKPLFYRYDDGIFWFGSELKSIIADRRVPRRPDLAALDCQLAHGFIPSPLSPFEGISQVPPATMVQAGIGQPKPLRFDRYWTPVASERRIGFDDAVAELDARLLASVQAQMVSDVPLGAFLSGGLDSASVVAAMRRHGADVRSFSMGFAESSFDERSEAAHTAAVLGARHTEDVVDLDLESTILDVSETNDDMLADGSLLAVDRLCALTRRHVTVALSGDGADEMLAGYPTYAATYLARAWRHVPGPLRHLTNEAASLLPVRTHRYALRDFAKRFLQGAEAGPGRDFGRWRLYADDDVRQLLWRGQQVDGRAVDRYADAVDDAAADTLLKRLLIADLTHYLPGDMLAKVDRASMRHGLEVRVPFLDPDVIEFSLSLPSHFLLSPRGTTKKVLRAHVEKRVSPRIAHGKKRGFGVPIGAALRGPLGDFFARIFATEPFATDGPVNARVFQSLLQAHRDGLEDHSFALYAGVTMALWWQRYIAEEPVVA